MLRPFVVPDSMSAYGQCGRRQQQLRNFFRSPNNRMPADGETRDPTSVCAANAENFAKHLRRRGQAAKGLEEDLLTEVPLLYGSPGSIEPDGDPGIALARAHLEELVRRNGGDAKQASGERSDVALPYEGAVTALAILLLLFFVFAD